MFYAVPNYIIEEIDRKLDEAIAQVPEAECDREALRSQLLDYVNEHGNVPEFSLAKAEVGK